MISTQLLADFFAGGLLLATFMMIGKIRLLQMLRYFAIASFFLAALGGIIAFSRGEPELYIGPIATILFKVIFIPAFISYTAKKIPSSYQLKMYIRPATTYFLFALILIISAIIVRNLPSTFSSSGGIFQDVFFFRSLLFISIALILSGFSLIIIRKDLFSQVLGLMTIENGIAAFGLVALNDVPLFLEMGVFFVIMVSTIIMALLTEKVHEVYLSGDTENLNELID